MIGEEPEAAYQDALQMLSESYKDGIRAFAQYMAKHWTMTPEQWRKMTADDCPSDDWFVGRNDGVKEAINCAEHFLGDFHP